MGFVIITAILILAFLMVNYYIINDEVVMAAAEQVSIVCFPTTSPTQMFNWNYCVW
jgi:hypothetical protein